MKHSRSQRAKAMAKCCSSNRRNRRTRRNTLCGAGGLEEKQGTENEEYDDSELGDLGDVKAMSGLVSVPRQRLIAASTASNDMATFRAAAKNYISRMPPTRRVKMLKSSIAKMLVHRLTNHEKMRDINPRDKPSGLRVIKRVRGSLFNPLKYVFSHAIRIEPDYQTIRIAIAPDGTIVVSENDNVESEPCIRVYDPKREDLVRSIGVQPRDAKHGMFWPKARSIFGYVTDFTFDDAGQMLVVDENKGIVQTISYADNKVIGRVGNRHDNPGAVAIDGDGNIAVRCTDSISVWNKRTGERIRSFPFSGANHDCNIAFDPQGNIVMSKGKGIDVIKYSDQTLVRHIAVPDDPRHPIDSFTFDGIGHLIVSTLSSVLILNYADGTIVQELTSKDGLETSTRRTMLTGIAVNHRTRELFVCNQNRIAVFKLQ